MQNAFANALSETISKHMPLSATRRETLAWLALLIMRHGTICVWRLAAHVATMATIDSVRRRFYRFFQYIELDGAMTARVVADLLGMRGKPWVLAMDRTNWEFGKTTINILMGASKSPKMRTLPYGIECDSEKPRDFIGTRHEAARFFRFFRAAEEAAEDAGFS